MNSKMNSKISIILGELSNIMLKRGEGFRAKAYQTAKDAIDQYPKEITLSDTCGVDFCSKYPG